MSSEYPSQRFDTQSLRNRKVYNFRSVGELTRQVELREEAFIPPPQPIGIQTPMHTGTKSLFHMSFDQGDQIADNLRNLIQTNHGERLGLYDFGANLQELVFEFHQDAYEQEAVRRINKAVNKYMPYVLLETFESYTDHKDNKEVAKVAIKITYKIPVISDTKRSLEIMLYVGG
jgi:phage baseplate assembly protein W